LIISKVKAPKTSFMYLCAINQLFNKLDVISERLGRNDTNMFLQVFVINKQEVK
jgi:hypothetical protein